MTREGNSYKEIQRERLLCPECGRDLAKGSLEAHRQTQNDVVKVGSGQEGYKEGRSDEPRTFRMEFPAKAGPRPCLFEGCSGRVATRADMRVQLWHWHIWYTVVILEEGNLPHPR